MNSKKNHDLSFFYLTCSRLECIFYVDTKNLVTEETEMEKENGSLVLLALDFLARVVHMKDWGCQRNGAV